MPNPNNYPLFIDSPAAKRIKDFIPFWVNILYAVINTFTFMFLIDKMANSLTAPKFRISNW